VAFRLLEKQNSATRRPILETKRMLSTSAAEPAGALAEDSFGRSSPPAFGTTAATTKAAAGGEDDDHDPAPDHHDNDDVDDDEERHHHHHHDDYFYWQDDDPAAMTFGRRIARYLMKRYKWYNPQLGTRKEEPPADDGNNKNNNKNAAPSLDKAWAYFEHVTLQRYIVEEELKTDHRGTTTTTTASNSARGGEPPDQQPVTQQLLHLFRRGIGYLFQGNHQERRLAEPGEKQRGTKLYSTLSTPLAQMADFGIGYGLYFSTLRSIAILSLVLGLINIPKMMYFAGEEYNGDPSQNSNNDDGSGLFLAASAICPDTSWVPCPTCNAGQLAIFPPNYPITRNAWFGFTFRPTVNGAGDWLNVTDSAFVADDGFDYVNVADLLSSSESSDSTVNNRNDTLFPPTETMMTMMQCLDQDITGLDMNNATAGIGDGGGGDCWVNVTADIDCTTDINGGCFIDLTAPTATAAVLAAYNITGNAEFLSQTGAGGFALKNNCDGATLQQGFINYASLFVLILGSLVIYYRSHRLEVAFDEDEQTAQDYSVLIKNPPPDAYDPAEWKAFFVTSLTRTWPSARSTSTMTR
jgi:hypothetical protein